MRDKYQGQLWGGPQHGNIISSSVARVMFRREDWMYADGDKGNPYVTGVGGAYVWDAEAGRYNWEGPGADGDTIERLRLGSAT